jgi:hypothetical protein
VAKDRLAVLNVHVVAVEQPDPLEVPSGEANTAAVIATVSADQSRHHQVHAIAIKTWQSRFLWNGNATDKRRLSGGQ